MRYIRFNYYSNNRLRLFQMSDKSDPPQKSNPPVATTPLKLKTFTVDVQPGSKMAFYSSENRNEYLTLDHSFPMTIDEGFEIVLDHYDGVFYVVDSFWENRKELAQLVREDAREFKQSIKVVLPVDFPVTFQNGVKAKLVEELDARLLNIKIKLPAKTKLQTGDGARLTLEADHIVRFRAGNIHEQQQQKFQKNRITVKLYKDIVLPFSCSRKEVEYMFGFEINDTGYVTAVIDDDKIIPFPSATAAYYIQSIYRGYLLYNPNYDELRELFRKAKISPDIIILSNTSYPYWRNEEPKAKDDKQIHPSDMLELGEAFMKIANGENRFAVECNENTLRFCYCWKE